MQSPATKIVIGPNQRGDLDALLRQLQQRGPLMPEEVALREHELAMQHKQETLAGVAVVALLFPLVVAVAMRIMRRGTKAPLAVQSPLDNERFSRLEQAVDAIALEIERIGEAQRFQTKLMSETANAVKVVPREASKAPI